MAGDWERIDTGSPDRRMMVGVRDVALRHEPLIADASFDDPLDPQELRLHVDGGITNDSGRFDVTWTDRRCYRYHYTEGDGFDARYDRHPRPDVPDRHFHEPPDAEHDDAVPCCIGVESVQLVTLAVLQLWRDAVESGEPARLQGGDPP